LFLAIKEQKPLARLCALPPRRQGGYVFIIPEVEALARGILDHTISDGFPDSDFSLILPDFFPHCTRLLIVQIPQFLHLIPVDLQSFVYRNMPDDRVRRGNNDLYGFTDFRREGVRPPTRTCHGITYCEQPRLHILLLSSFTNPQPIDYSQGFGHFIKKLLNSIKIGFQKFCPELTHQQCVISYLAFTLGAILQDHNQRGDYCPNEYSD